MSKNSKSETLNSKKIQNFEIQNSKKFRVFEFEALNFIRI